MFFSLLQATAATDPVTFLGSSPAGWITNGIVIALVLFIRHLYERQIEGLTKRIDNLDDRDMKRSELFDRALKASEEAVTIAKDQNQMAKEQSDKQGQLLSNILGRLEENDDVYRRRTKAGQ